MINDSPGIKILQIEDLDLVGTDEQCHVKILTLEKLSDILYCYKEVSPNIYYDSTNKQNS